MNYRGQYPKFEANIPDYKEYKDLKIPELPNPEEVS
jgi:hypothetical protein